MCQSRAALRASPAQRFANGDDDADQLAPCPVRNTVPVFVRSLRKCADFCYSVFSVWSYMSDLSILKICELSGICAAIGE